MQRQGPFHANAAQPSWRSAVLWLWFDLDICFARACASRNREELVRLQRRAPGEATPPGPAGTSGSETVQAGEPTRALGFMEAKRQGGGVMTIVENSTASIAH